MIAIEKNQDGFFDIVLTDKKDSFVSNVFDFVFQNQTTNEIVELTLTDISQFPERISRFEFSSTDFQSETPGFWLYFVKQNDVIFANGRMTLISESTTFSQYDGKDKSFFVYSTQ